MKTNQIAKAGTAAGLLTLLLIVCIVLLTGCNSYDPNMAYPPTLVQAAQLGTYNGGYPPAVQQPNYLLAPGQPSQAQYQY